MSAKHNSRDEARDVPQLRVHFEGRDQAAQALSAPRRGFSTLPTNDNADPNRAAIVPAHGDLKAEAPRSDLPLRTASSIGSRPGPYLCPPSQAEPLDKSLAAKIQSLIPTIHRCRRCRKFYDTNHNEAGDCQTGHSGKSNKSHAAFEDCPVTMTG